MFIYGATFKLFDKIKTFITDELLFLYTILIIFTKSIFLLYLINSADNITTKIFLKNLMNLKNALICFGIIMVVFSISFLSQKKVRLWLLFIMNLAISILFMIDVWYYRAFGGFAKMYLLSQTANLDNLEESIFSMMHWYDFLIIIDIVIILILILFKKNFANNMTRKTSITISVYILSFLILGGYWYNIKYINTKGNNLFSTKWREKSNIEALSPIGYHLLDVFRYLKTIKRPTLTDKEKKDIHAWFKNNQENTPDNMYSGMMKGKNLLIIQTESLEEFIIGQKYNGQEITPNINKLLNNSIFFTNINEQVNNGVSSDSDLMTNTSVYPIRSGSTFFRFPNNKYNSLPNMLKKNGYSTLAIHPDKGTYWNWMTSLYSIGFDKCIDSNSFKNEETINLGISDKSYLKQVEPIIKGQKTPFYTFMVTLTSHTPFNLPDKYKYLDLPDDFDKTKMGGYFQCLNYTDKHLGELLDSLDKDGVLDNTVVVITGDHAGITRYFSGDVLKMNQRELWWPKTEKKVPFIIYNKNIKGKKIDTIGGQVDIMPTVAYIMGLNKGEFEQTAFGKNLFTTKKNFTILSSGKIIGTNVSQEDTAHAKKGISFSDKIIQSDYYKNVLEYK